MRFTSNQLRVERALRGFLTVADLPPDGRLPPFHVIARSLDTSVTVLQAVMPRLVADGTVEIIPRVGTFLRVRPLSSLDVAAHIDLRFFLAESPNGTSRAWKEIAIAFERLHPQVRIHFTLGLSHDSLLWQPDLCLLLHGEARRLYGQGECAEWANEDVWLPSQRVAYARAIWEREHPTWAVPVQLGMPVLFTRRGSGPELDPLTIIRLSQPLAAESGGFGLVVSDPMEIAWACGLGSGGVSRADINLQAWLTALEVVPPPALVSRTDFADTSLIGIIDPLVNVRCARYLGSLWMARLIDTRAWDVSSLPGAGPVRFGAMSLIVTSKGDKGRMAEELARFIAGPSGQAIIAQYDTLLPTLCPSLAGHRYAPLLQQVESRGVAAANVWSDDGWDERYAHAMVRLDELRAGRILMHEALDALCLVDDSPR